MKKLIRLLFRLFLFIVLIIAGIFTINTIRFSSKQVKVAALEKVEVSDKVVTRLSEVIQIPTVSYPQTIDTAAFLRFNQFLVQKYPLIDSLLQHEIINDYSHIYKWQGRNTKLNPILLMGHIDVVPVENSSMEYWEVPPFSGKIEENHVWGRGTLDDKASILGILEAINMLLQEDYTPNRTIYLAFGHDEEVSGHHGAEAIAQQFKKQKIVFEYVLDEGSTMIDNAIAGLDAPLALVGLAEKGYTTLTLTAQLKDGGHSSMPPDETAVGMLSKAITNLQNQPFPAKIDGAVASLFRHIGPEMNLFSKVLFANLWLTEDLVKAQFAQDGSTNALIRTTIAPTMLRGGFKENVLPTKASAKINFRILPGETPASVMEYVKTTINNPKITVQYTDGKQGNDPSPISNTDSFGFETIQTTIQQLTPEAVVSPSLVIAATDSRYFTEVAKDVYRYTPIMITRHDLSRFHGLNERINIEQYKQKIRFFKQLVLNSCQ